MTAAIDERQNLIARIEGGSGPSLMLLHGPSMPRMKGELAARAAAVAVFARSGASPAGDIVLIAESDEERNTGDVGLSRLVRDRPDIHCDYAINEGGGLLLELANGQRVVTVSVGEKRVTSARIRVHGRAGHASIPEAADNPLVHAARAVERLAAAQTPHVISPVLERALTAMGAEGTGEDALTWAASQHPDLGYELSAMARLTVTPTGLATHEPANVIPPYADIVCDCRAVPTQDEGDIRAHVQSVLGSDLEWDFELLEPLAGGTESSIDSPLYRAIEAYVEATVPGATLVPLVTAGFTDSHWVREEFATVAYGFAPVFEMDVDRYLGGMHGADESLGIADLTEMARFHLRMLEAASSFSAPGVIS